MHKSVRHGDGSLQYTILPQDTEEREWHSRGRGDNRRCTPRTVVTTVLFLLVCAGIVAAVLVPLYLNGSEAEDGNVGPAPFGDLGQAVHGDQPGEDVNLQSPSKTKNGSNISPENMSEKPDLDKTTASSNDSNTESGSGEKVTTVAPEVTRYRATEKTTSSTETTWQAVEITAAPVHSSTAPTPARRKQFSQTTEITPKQSSTPVTAPTSEEESKELKDIFDESSKTQKNSSNHGMKQEDESDKKFKGKNETTQSSTYVTEANNKDITVEPTTNETIHIGVTAKGHGQDQSERRPPDNNSGTGGNLGPADADGKFFPSVQFGTNAFDFQDFIAIAVVGGFIIVLLMVTTVCFIIRRRKKKTVKRKAGKMVTDLQSGDNVMLLTGSSEEE